ncbi:MAG TPA: AAA family ATPase [Terriglobales bacterium]|nr:AAA family ATPase [Terriglobales bacterium]
MLTRLQVSGFKNLVAVDVRFGPFTCIAGANGVGKSNLLDAIAFLSALADRPLMDAALSVRDEEGRTGDVRNIFHRVGREQAESMSFEVEMIVPREGIDDLGQTAKASITFLKYKLALGQRKDEGPRSLGNIEILREELSHVKISDARKQLRFPHDYAWLKSAVTGQRRTPWFISTDTEDSARVIRIHQDGGSSGKPRPLLASTLPRTALSAANAAESPTAMLARRELQSWRRLQLEPSALRRPDPFTAPAKMGSDGSHLPAALYDLAKSPSFSKFAGKTANPAELVYTQVANRLSELIEDVRSISVDRDEKRELLTIQVVDRDGTTHPARALSDGTLRFLALAVIEMNPESQGLLCLEEPENGIHPARIPAMLRLLQDIATDVSDRVGPENPLRQVIINTHSPSVVAQVPEDSLLMADLKTANRNGRWFKKLSFSCLPNTWRASTGETEVIPKGQLLSYLIPVASGEPSLIEQRFQPVPSDKLSRRVIDRPEVQLAFGFAGNRQ